MTKQLYGCWIIQKGKAGLVLDMTRKHGYKRRYRQIGRLLYYFCCVRYMKRVDGKWEQQEVECPVCNGDGEFLIEDDVYTCCLCDGLGYITAYRYKKWCEEMEL